MNIKDRVIELLEMTRKQQKAMWAKKNKIAKDNIKSGYVHSLFGKPKAVSFDYYMKHLSPSALQSKRKAMNKKLGIKK